MPIRWDPLLVRRLAHELNERLAGAHAQSIRLDGSSRRLVLFLREATLVWHLHPRGGAIVLDPPVEPDPGDLPLPGRVRGVRALTDERILVVDVLPKRRREHVEIIVELLGNQWNAWVTSGAEARIRHVLVRRPRGRPTRVGSVYEAPAPSSREGAGEPLSLERWNEILVPVPPPDRRRALVSTVAWTSTLNAEAFLEGRADPAEALSEGHGLWRTLAFENLPPAPCVLTTPKGLQPYPWPLPGLEAEPAESLLDAVRRCWAQEEGDSVPSAAAAALPPELITALERALEDAERKCTRLQAEWDGLEDEGALRARGDLMLARFREVPQGVADFVLENFDGSPVHFSVDPARTTKENAEAFYERAARVARARRRLPRLLEGAERDRSRLESLLRRTHAGEATVEEVREQVSTRHRPRGRPDEPAALPYRVFKSSGGLEIRVGRGARHNDDLTFHHAAPEDIWLHARHAAGAHVVLRWDKPGNPPGRDLEEAAVLAALHSKARTSGSAPVDWTRRKYVRKPRGASPGSVVPQRVQTLFVELDPSLMDTLDPAESSDEFEVRPDEAG